MNRIAQLSRQTNETSIEVLINLDGTGTARPDTGIGFLDHMLVTLARHASFDLELSCRGDLDVDDHHTSEDCALALGAVIDEALGERVGIARFGSAYAPLDEALARSVVDLSGRPHAQCTIGLRGDRLGAWATENVSHFLSSLAAAGRLTLHVDVLRGDNDHHRCEAAFKATALALRQAVAMTGTTIPSTKGVL